MSTRSSTCVFFFSIVTFLIVGCGHKESPKAVAALLPSPAGTPVEIAAPLGLPPVPIPSGNKPTVQTIALGRKLYYDPRLSGDASIACANCHNPQLGFTDRRAVSVGVSGQQGKRNAPTVINAVYNSFQFWDGRALTLEAQAGGPIANPLEMNQTHDACVGKLEGDREYKRMFAEAFGPGPVTIGEVEMAVASFERTLVSGNSPFDRYQFSGDKNAMSPAAIRGLALFKDSNKGNCAKCHTINDTYALFTDGKFHNLGVSVNEEGELTDLGRYVETGAEADKGAFRTPSLRNVALTGPYMHNGSEKTLRRVVDFYAGGGNSNPQLDREIKELHLSGPERDDLVSFLESLTGDPPANAGRPEIP